MDKKRKMMMILPLIVVGVAIVLMVYLFFFGKTSKGDASFVVMAKVYNVFAIIALISSLFYIVTGFQKSSAKYFKLFLYTYVLSCLTQVLVQAILSVELSNPRLLSLGLKIIEFILLSILLLKNDLGKKLSTTITLFALGSSVVYWALPVLYVPAQILSIMLISNFSLFSLALVLVIMEHLKYYDKKQRNTK